MATSISRIHLLGIGGKTHTCQFPNETFADTTISELKLEVQRIMSSDMNNRLIYGRQELHTVRNGREMTFGDYNILDKSTVRLDWYLVEQKMQINVKLLRGDTLTFEVEPDLTILEVKEMLEFLTQIDPDEMRLLFAGRQLEDDRTLWDYNILTDSTFQMVQRVTGGGDIAVLTFTDVTSEQMFKVCKFGRGPRRKTLGSGLNFRGTCRNRSCDACNKIVYVRKGFYPDTNGLCNLSRRMTEMNCPICNKCLAKRDICGISIHKCTLRIEGKVVNGERFDYTVESTGNCYKRALSLNDDDDRDYDYLELTVKPLEVPNPPNDPNPLDVPSRPVGPKPFGIPTPAAGPSVPTPTGRPSVPTPTGRPSVPTPTAGKKPKNKPKRNKFLSFFFGSE